MTLDFKGVAGTEGFSTNQLDKAAWRYGFLAHLDDGSRVYSDVFSKSDGAVAFTVPANTKFLWLVVMGAPTEHWVRAGGRGGGGGGRRGRGGATTNAVANTKLVVSANRGGAASNASEQWPYKFRLTGTAPEDAVVQ